MHVTYVATYTGCVIWSSWQQYTTLSVVVQHSHKRALFSFLDTLLSVNFLWQAAIITALRALWYLRRRLAYNSKVLVCQKQSVTHWLRIKPSKCAITAAELKHRHFHMLLVFLKQRQSANKQRRMLSCKHQSQLSRTHSSHWHTDIGAVSK